MKTAHK